MGVHYGLRPEGNNPYVPDFSTDPYFNNVSLLLHGNGTNGAQNNTFLDSSTNNNTITRNGTATQGTNTPFSQSAGYWSNYFDGNGDYLQTPTSSVLAANSTNYTVEAWAYLDLSTYSGFDLAGRGIVSDFGANANGRWLFTINSGGFLAFEEQDAAGSNGVAITDSVAFPLRTWTHVMAVKSGTTMYLFKNGVLVNTGTSSSRTTFVGRLNIGQATIDTNYRGYFIGYISNVRFLNGTALYTSSFTPPTSPLTSVTNTSLLTCQDNIFIDKSSNNFVITVFGNSSIQPYSPFLPTAAYSTSVNGGSVYLNNPTYPISGGSFLLANAPSNELNFGPGDFTVELWLYASGLDSGYNSIFAFAPTHVAFSLYINNFKLNLWVGGGSIVTGNTTIGPNRWYHVAITRQGTNLRVFLNGVQDQTTGTNSTNIASNTGVRVGQDIFDTGNGAFFGYVSDFRVVKGTAVYTTTFTPPTAPLTAITNTTLLLSAKNAGIFDNAIKNDLETVGNAQIITSIKKFGTGSMSFDGTGDYLVTNSSETNSFAFGSGDFTIEFWIYPTSFATGIKAIYDQRPTSTQGLYPTIYTNTSGVILYYTNSANRITGSTLSINAWYHIAVCRSSSNTKMFVNGVQVGSTYTDSNIYLNSSGRPFIGAFGDSQDPNQQFNGYIDDLRITKGVARYTADFIPPTAAFPNR